MTVEYEAVIGLEVHCQLKTRTKMFTGAGNVFGLEPNTQIDPTVLGLPGALPVANALAIEFGYSRCHRCRWARGRTQQVRSQTLFLSRPAQGLPDHSIR